ncbi:MAG: PAS domain-containing protein, partial [Candidatus Brocadiia bacterium]
MGRGVLPEREEAFSVVLLAGSDSEAELVARDLEESGLDCAVTEVETLAAFREAIQHAAPGEDLRLVAMVSGMLPEAMVFDALATARSASARIGLLVVGGPHYHGRLTAGIPTWGARHVPDDSVGLLPEFVRRVLDEARSVEGMCARARMPAYDPVREVSGRIWPLMSSLMPQAFIKDADLRFVWATDCFAADLVTTPARLIGRDDTGIFPPEEAQTYRAEDRAVLQGGDPVYDDQYAKIPIPDRHGRPVAMVAVRRARDTSLVEVLRIISRWASIVETTPDAMAYLSPAGVVRSWNPGAEMLYCYTRQVMEGQHLRKVARGAAEAELERLLDTARQGETIKDHEAVHVDGEGRTRDVSITLAPVVSLDGEVVGVTFTARDIADRRRTEERLQ